MKRALSAAIIGVSLLMTQLSTEVSQAAEVKAFVTGAAKRVFTALAPQFEAAGHKVTAEFDLPPSLMKRVDAGEPYDVIILSYHVKPLIDRGANWSPTRGPRSGRLASVSLSKRVRRSRTSTRPRPSRNPCSMPS